MNIYLCLQASLLLFLSSTLQAADIQLNEGWVSAPLSETASTVAAFGVIANLSQQEVTIVGASSDYAEKVQFHRIEHIEGLVKMVLVPSIQIPSKGQVSLTADGLHLMLMGLQKMPWKEDHISIHLVLNTGDEVTQRFKLRGRNQTQTPGKERGHH